jgi:hypothetical protein
MENYNGLIGSIAVGVLKNGLQKTTKVQLIVCLPVLVVYVQTLT